MIDEDSQADSVSEREALLDLESVPPVSIVRWRPRQKAQVVGAVRAGLLTAEEACRLYKLTAEELAGWIRRQQLFGTEGLRVTRSAEFRERPLEDEQRAAYARWAGAWTKRPA